MAQKITKHINNQFIPSYVSGYPVYAYGGFPETYALGSWLKSNAGNLLQTGLGAGAMLIPGMQGIGAGLMTSGVGGLATTGDTIGNQQETERQYREDALKKERIDNLPGHHEYQSTFKKGGWIQKATASIKRRGTEGVCSGSNFGGPGCPPGSKRYNLAKTFKAMAKKPDGGFLSNDMFQLPNYEMGGNLDNTTNYKAGGTHQSNPMGGIPLANNALVEEGEVRFNLDDGESYISSNRIPYKKK